MKNRLKIVDLFCGCGGFGLGAKLAGFDVVVAVDIDATLQSAYKTNFPSTRVLTGDLSKMDSDAWKIALGKEDIDGVIGGPPCQGYSRMGRGDTSDPRRSLLYHFFRHVNIIQPKFFVMENVEGLLDEGNVEELQSAISKVDKRYSILGPIMIDASWYGAPTKRKRVVVIGYDPKNFSNIAELELTSVRKTNVTVKEAIQDVPAPVTQSKNVDDIGWAKYRVQENLSEYAKKMRAMPNNNIGSLICRDKLKAGFTSGNFDTIHTDKVKNRFASIRPGFIDKVSRAKRLQWDGLCPTLRAGTGEDKGSHQAVRPLHPVEDRAITVREAARLQGFPDWFLFHKTKWHSFRMIGNSVSPILSESILSLIKNKMLSGTSKESIG